MSKKSGKRWTINRCGRCGESHISYSGKLDSVNIEYVVCGNTNKRMNINADWSPSDDHLNRTEIYMMIYKQMMDLQVKIAVDEDLKYDSDKASGLANLKAVISTNYYYYYQDSLRYDCDVLLGIQNKGSL